MRVTTAMCRARFNRRSPPRLMRWRTVFPDEAGMGFTPARLAKAASDRTRPGWDHAARATAAVTGPMPGWSRSLRAGLSLRSAVICLALAASSWSAARTRFASRTASARGNFGRERLLTSTPGGDRGDVAAGECPAGVNPEVGHPQQGCQRVDRGGPFSAEVIPRGDEDSHRGAHAVVGSRPTQLRHLKWQDGLCDAASIERVGFADAAVGAGVHPGGLGDEVSRVGCGT